jgi:hypothetical protein
MDLGGVKDQVDLEDMKDSVEIEAKKDFVGIADMKDFMEAVRDFADLEGMVVSCRDYLSAAY